jgi:hypothetical protein
MPYKDPEKRQQYERERYLRKIGKTELPRFAKKKRTSHRPRKKCKYCDEPKLKNSVFCNRHKQEYWGRVNRRNKEFCLAEIRRDKFFRKQDKWLCKNGHYKKRNVIVATLFECLGFKKTKVFYEDKLPEGITLDDLFDCFMRATNFIRECEENGITNGHYFYTGEERAILYWFNLSQMPHNPRRAQFTEIIRNNELSLQYMRECKEREQRGRYKHIAKVADLSRDAAQVYANGLIKTAALAEQITKAFAQV